MSDAELSFARAHLDRLAGQPVSLPDDFVTPAEHKPRKPLTVDIPLQDPPTVEQDSSKPASSSSTINLTVKSLKPAFSCSLPSSPLDSISSLKTQLHKAHAGMVPPASHQRWLLKGKALGDDRLLREYEIAEGGVVTLSVKPGWVAPTAETTTEAASTAVPSLTLSDPSSSSSHAVPLEAFSSPSTTLPPGQAHYHSIIAQPSFWTGLDAYLKGQFGEVQGAEEFWETTLLGQKRYLKEGEVALIRDQTGITGMGGGGH